MRGQLYAFLGVVILAVPLTEALAATPDFTLECTETKDVLKLHREFADCTVTGIDGYEGRVNIACSVDVPKIKCGPTWHPYISNANPVQHTILHNKEGYIPIPDNETIGTWTITGTSEDGAISHEAIITGGGPMQSMFVIPEYPIGPIAGLLASIGALGAYLKFRR